MSTPNFIYDALPPAAANPADILRTIAATVPRPPDVGPWATRDGIYHVGYTVALTAGQVSAYQTAVAATAADPNAPWRIQDTLTANIAAALVRLRQIQTQATAANSKGNYGANNLANLNDLLATTRLIAVAVGDVAADLVAIARILANQLDGTT